MAKFFKINLRKFGRYGEIVASSNVITLSTGNGSILSTDFTDATLSANISTNSKKFQTFVKTISSLTTTTTAAPILFPVGYLVVAGGGGGAQGGGGAGGFRTGTFNVSSIVTCNIQVGGGGGAGNDNSSGGKGTDSIFNTITSTGGGGGGSRQTVGNPGGSGGGAGRDYVYNQGGGAGNIPETIPSQGNPGGGSGGDGDFGGAGGGGGAGSAGLTGFSNGTAGGERGGNGGIGADSSITGSVVTYAGGGGGAAQDVLYGAISGVGGLGGGGSAGNLRPGANGQNGQPNRGAGGGGSVTQFGASAGSGGSGIVILSVPDNLSVSFSAGIISSSAAVGANIVYSITGGSGTVTFAPITTTTTTAGPIYYSPQFGPGVGSEGYNFVTINTTANLEITQGPPNGSFRVIKTYTGPNVAVITPNPSDLGTFYLDSQGEFNGLQYTYANIGYYTYAVEFLSNTITNSAFRTYTVRTVDPYYFSLTASPNPVYEGFPVTWTLSSPSSIEYMPELGGRYFRYELSGNITAGDVDSLSGQVLLTGAIGSRLPISFTTQIMENTSIEGQEDLRMDVYSWVGNNGIKPQGAVSIANDTVLVQDTSYTIQSTAAQVYEGYFVYWTIDSTGPVYYGDYGRVFRTELSGIGFQKDDAVPNEYSTTLTGAANSRLPLTVITSISEDYVTEGTETLDITLYTYPANGPKNDQPFANASVQILEPSFELISVPNVVAEGSSVKWIINSTGLINYGTTGRWFKLTFSGANIDGNDITESLGDLLPLEESFLLSGTVGSLLPFSFTTNITADYTTEGVETLTVNLYSWMNGSIESSAAIASTSIQILDTSQSTTTSTTTTSTTTEAPTTTTTSTSTTTSTTTEAPVGTTTSTTTSTSTTTTTTTTTTVAPATTTTTTSTSTTTTSTTTEVSLQEDMYTSPGVYSWTAPTGINSICVVCVGGGGGGGSVEGGGGGGGGLGWKNNIAVIPGQSYSLQVGAGGITDTNGQDSWFSTNQIVVAGLGGSRGRSITEYTISPKEVPGGAGGSYLGDGGGVGGRGGNNIASRTLGGQGGGGGGAGGYLSQFINGVPTIDGNGGDGSRGRYDQTFNPIPGGTGLGGAAGGAGAGIGVQGVAGGAAGAGAGGGGVGVLGQGDSGVGGLGTKSTPGDSQVGFGGSGGGNGEQNINNRYCGSQGGRGGYYGGGGGGGGGGNSTCVDAVPNSQGGAGASGAVRIIWGVNRSFPSTNTAPIKVVYSPPSEFVISPDIEDGWNDLLTNANPTVVFKLQFTGLNLPVNLPANFRKIYWQITDTTLTNLDFSTASSGESSDASDTGQLTFSITARTDAGPRQGSFRVRFAMDPDFLWTFATTSVIQMQIT